MTLDTNTSLGGRYRLEHRLAAGGMGEVWRALDATLNREVAVKLLRLDSLADEAAIKRFGREAKTTARLQHPHIVSILDAGNHDGTTFIVMELLNGPTLAQYLAERGPLPEPEVLGLATQIAAGLGAAHKAGIIHRDLKPNNLMFDSAGRLKILDFGIARLTEATTSRLTVTNAIIGTPAYLSPEQATGSPVDERSDLYSLGCILTTMATGSPPFAGDHPVATLHQHVHEPPPLLRQRQPAVSPALESVVQELLQKSPELRPQSAQAVERQLAAIAGPSALQATIPLGHSRRTRPLPTLVDAPAAANRPARRLWALATAAIVAVLALTGALLAPLLTPEREPADTPTAARTATPTPSRPTSPPPTPTPSGLGTTSPSPQTKPTRPKPKPPKTHHPKKKDHGPKRPKG